MLIKQIALPSHSTDATIGADFYTVFESAAPVEDHLAVINDARSFESQLNADDFAGMAHLIADCGAVNLPGEGRRID